MSAGGGRLVGVVVVNGFAMFLDVEVETWCPDLKDEVLEDADLRLLFDSLLEPNFLKNEGMFADDECEEVSVRVAIAFVCCCGRRIDFGSHWKGRFESPDNKEKRLAYVSSLPVSV